MAHASLALSPGQLAAGPTLAVGFAAYGISLNLTGSSFSVLARLIAMLLAKRFRGRWNGLACAAVLGYPRTVNPVSLYIAACRSAARRFDFAEPTAKAARAVLELPEFPVDSAAEAAEAASIVLRHLQRAAPSMAVPARLHALTFVDFLAARTAFTRLQRMPVADRETLALRALDKVKRAYFGLDGTTPSLRVETVGHLRRITAVTAVRLGLDAIDGAGGQPTELTEPTASTSTTVGRPEFGDVAKLVRSTLDQLFHDDEEPDRFFAATALRLAYSWSRSPGRPAHHVETDTFRDARREALRQLFAQVGSCVEAGQKEAWRELRGQAFEHARNGAVAELLRTQTGLMHPTTLAETAVELAAVPGSESNLAEFAWLYAALAPGALREALRTWASAEDHLSMAQALAEALDTRETPPHVLALGFGDVPQRNRHILVRLRRLQAKVAPLREESSR